jgi:hypothetical protein
MAQRTTGTIIGTVTDDTGAVLPGVTVTLKSAAVPGTPTTVTSETGVYRFPALPPGEYALSFTLQGFTTINREQIPLAVGGTEEVNVQLKVSAIAESITVTGESPVVNVASTQITTNFSHDWVQNAPQRRFTFFDLINQAAGVSANTSTSSRSQSFGSSTNENSYQLDGTDFTAPLTGAAWPWPNTDAIQEVEVLSLGASAEYGNVQGAVFNVVTRQGSNTFHGDGNFYYQNQSLTARNTTPQQDCVGVDDCPAAGLPYHRARFRDTTWQLGGPVVKDKFWFFGSFQFQQDYESQPGTRPEFPARSQAKRIFYKLNYQVNEKNKVMFAYHDDFYRIPGRATALAAPSTIGVENGHNPSPNLTWTSVLTNKTYLEARYSGFYGKDHSDPLESGEPRVKPRFRDLDTGQITGGIYSWYDGDSWKTGFNVKLSHFADRFLGGSHDLKLGVQYNEGGSDYIIGYNDYIYTYGTTPSYGYTQLPFHRGGTMRGLGGFVDDTYRLGSRVVLNMGLRYDYSKAMFESKPVLDRNGAPTSQMNPGADNLFAWKVVSPRIGLTFKMNESGRSVLKAHYGRYYRGIVTGEFDNATPSITPRYFFDGVYDAGGNPLGLSLVSDNRNLRIDPNYKSPYTDQFIVGFEQELANNLGVQVNYVHKRSRNFGAWPDIAGTYTVVPFLDNVGKDPTGQTFNLFKLTSDSDSRIFQLQTDSRMFADYNGVSIQANKRLAQNWLGIFSLVLSKSTGRLGSSLGRPIDGQTSSAGGSSSGGGLPGLGANPNDFINSEGRLIGDRPVVGKVQLVYNLPAGFMVGMNYQYQTGRLWSRMIRPAGLGFPSRPRILTEPNTGDRRVPDWNLVDLRVQKDFKFTPGGANFAVFGDILNATNSDAYEGIGTGSNGGRIATAADYGVPTRFIAPRRLMVGGKIRF